MENCYIVGYKLLKEDNFTGSDCHMLASYGVYDPDKRNIALEWLREAVARLDEDIEWKEYQHKLVLDYAHVLLETGKSVQ